MKTKLIYLIVIFSINLLLISCSNKIQDDAADKDTNTSTGTAALTLAPTVPPANTQEPVPEASPTPEPAPKPSATPIPTVAPEPELTLPPLSPDNFDPTATISDTIPAKYTTRRDDFSGTIKYIIYDTYAYYGNQSKLRKSAYVYLPYGYDESKKYNVLYLMHGIGGNEGEWGMVSNNSTVKIIMDNLIYYGDIEPFIIVTPNGRSGMDFANTNSDQNAFYKFGQELRNDLIPYIEANFSTYADYDENGYDLTTSREHRAMAGLSMGAMQTINIGICESLDILSYFGAFSACPTTYTSSQIANNLKKFEDYDIKYFYNICGTADGIAITHASNAVKNISSLTDKLTDDENLMWQELPGGNHDFKVWYLGFYNFAQLAFK